MMKLTILLFGVLAGACARAGDAIGEALDVTMLSKCGTHLKDTLFTRAYEADRRIDAEWAACADAEAVRVRQRTIRSAILDSMGGLPEGMPLDWVGATVPLTSAAVAEISWRKGADGAPKYEVRLPEGWKSEGQ